MVSPHDPPPRGFGPPAIIRYRWTWVAWAKQQEVQQAWKEIAKTHSLEVKELDNVDRVFGFLDGSVLSPFPLYYS